MMKLGCYLFMAIVGLIGFMNLANTMIINITTKKQEHYRKLCGRSYCKEYLDYIFVNEMGERWKPRYLSDGFKRILEQNGLRRIRFHDLRHSCASLLLANGVPMKMIQEWLGHSDFSTTANIYSHLDYASKVSSAEAMLNGLGMGSNPGNDT